MSLDAYINDLNALHLGSFNHSLDETLTVPEHQEIEWDGPESSSHIDDFYSEWEDDISEIGMESTVDIEEEEDEK
jgi:hypothetical protein